MNDRSIGQGIVNQLVVGMLAVVALHTLGCHRYANPFVDPYAGEVKISTASSVGALDVAKESSPSSRTFSEGRVAVADGSVAHGALFFEDGFGDSVSDDGLFAWTGEDFLTVLTWRARYLLNLGFFPISAVDTPPWCVMRSDGRPSRRVLGNYHDAARDPCVMRSCSRCEAVVHDAPS